MVDMTQILSQEQINALIAEYNEEPGKVTEKFKRPGDLYICAACREIRRFVFESEGFYAKDAKKFVNLYEERAKLKVLNILVESNSCNHIFFPLVDVVKNSIEYYRSTLTSEQIKMLNSYVHRNKMAI